MAGESIFSWLTGFKNKVGLAGQKRQSAQRHVLGLEALEDRVVLHNGFVPFVVDPPATFFEGVEVNLASTVVDPVGTPTYAWKVFKDGDTTPIETGSDATLSFTPDDNGTYEVELHVADDKSIGGFAIIPLTVVNQAPVFGVSGPTTCLSGEFLTLTLTKTDAALDTTDLEIDWDGDGSVDQTLNLGAGVTRGSVDSPVFFEPGLYTITVTATDKDLGTSAATHTVEVQSQTPVVGVTGPTTGSTGESLTFTLTATDAPEDAEVGFTFNIDWDSDGTVDETISASQGNGAGVSVTHAFTEPGPNTFSVTATDRHGAVSEPFAYDVNIIQPLSFHVLPSQVSLNASGLLPVVLFSTADFDVATLDLETLRLSGAAVVDSTFEDLDDDGDLDLILYFRRQNFLDEYAAALAGDLADGTLDDNHQDVELVLTGQTQGGADILGAAAVDFFMTGKKLDDLLGTL